MTALSYYSFIGVIAFVTTTFSAPDACFSRITCGECIRIPQCVWCSSPNFTSSSDDALPRCFRKGSEGFKCRALVALDKNHTVHENKDFSSRKDDVVQLRPQRVTVELRPGEAFDLKVSYKQAEDYPLDLYLLLDLSSSMGDDLVNLRKLGNDLVLTMKNLTSNFRIGFGSFVEKNALPFVRTTEADSSGINYSFKNHMSLVDDAATFVNQLKAADVISTYDNPESGFDGLMQAIVCKNIIGWRDQARRLVVFATDDASHWAGDGKLAGIIAPNDGECHLDQRGFFTQSLLQDYPSVGHINQVVKDNNINLIFAATSRVENQYKVLNKLIEGSYTAPLASDSSNVLELLKWQYGNITASVELKDTASGNVKVTYFSSCGNQRNESQTSICKGLQNKTQVDFTARIEVTSCPQNPSDQIQTFPISPIGISEALLVTVKMLCNCPCEKPGDPSYESNSKHCQSQGTLQCGICKCNPGRSGSNCECDLGSAEDAVLENSCKPNNQTEMLCSGKGACVCGKCECYRAPAISGKYCERNNEACDHSEGKLCGGNGVCDNGDCICNEGFSGRDCSCENAPQKCIPPAGGDVCSGNGVCQCGKCQCHQQLGAKGKYCETCASCPNKCEEFVQCYRCERSNLTEHQTIDGKPCRQVCRVEIRDEVKPQVENDGDRECHFKDENGCELRLVYTFDENGRKIIKVDELERSCPVPVDVAVVSGSAVGAVVLLGLLLLLLWRLLIYLYDKREWARFEEERKKAKWNAESNPLYRGASDTFANPTFGNSAY